jgi:APA family basic amino acid/polyamine antiporter
VRQLAAATVNNIIGSGIFALPAAVAVILGPSAIIAYVICGIAMALVALCFAEAGSRVSLTGGVYAYVETAFGPYAGYIVGTLFWFGAQILASAAVASLMVDSIRLLVPALPRVALLIAAYGGLAWVNVLGVRPGARLVEIVTVAKTAPLVLLIVLAVFAGRPANLAWTQLPTIGDVGRASLVLIFAFAGVETALTPGGEIKDPAKTVPRGVLAGLAVVVVLYAALQLAAQGILGPDLVRNPTAPLAVAAERVFHGGRLLMLVAAIVSTFGYVSGDMLATPRVLFALARDRLLPAQIAAVNQRYHTPATAIVIHAVVACVCAITGTFERLAVLSVLSLLIVYLACCLAVLRLRKRTSEGFQVPGGPVIPVLASMIMLWLILHATYAEFFWVGVMIALASVAYFITVNVTQRRVV